MATQAIPLFPIDDSEDNWRKELFDFLQVCDSHRSFP